ncbi:MAG: DUF4252 domain-containing protein [Bacteroidales bacterium]|nr:MAG: DUF4252 domain-containing protein [Bacteroidales bacterium]
MKRLILLMLLAFVMVGAKGQNSAVDKLFEKYSGQDGYTSILISKYMFSLFSDVNPENKEFNDLVSKLNSIKILASDSANNTEGVNFYKEIMKELPVKDYKELMIVKEKNHEMKFLVKEDNGKIIELLLVGGGKTNNVLICIQGEINLKNIAKLSKSMKIDGLENLEKIK